MSQFVALSFLTPASKMRKEMSMPPLSGTAYLSQEEILVELLDALSQLKKPELGTNRAEAWTHVSRNTAKALNRRRWDLTLARALATGDIEEVTGSDAIRITRKGYRHTSSRQILTRTQLREAIQALAGSSYATKAALLAAVRSKCDDIVNTWKFDAVYKREVASGRIKVLESGVVQVLKKK